jgi:hypothetical protein
MLFDSKKSGDNSSKDGHNTLCGIDFSLILIALEKKLFIP